uniref:BEACH domain-containing protein n=1 Tax=Rhabditophanes sp. KR3021 TaxID=114890 RepID=A0AC35UF35_9BILA
MTYRARVESIVDLRKIVRNTFVAAEYPKSMKLLYKNTPDESIPEFYDDASIFISVHGDEITDGGNPEPVMEDLIVPDWCDNPSNFITWHKDLLNSDKVSANLDEWIDLTFGYLLSGPEAVKALNVYHSLVETVVSDELRLHGPVQLFKKKHPKKESLPYEQAKHRQYFPYESFNEIMNANAGMAACPLNESFNLQKVVTNITEVKYYVPAYIKESIKSVAICIAEISVPEHSRNLLKSSRTFGKRLDRAKNLVREYFYKLPRNMAELVKTLIIEEAIPNKILSDLESLPNPLINHFNLSYYMSLTHTLISLLYINRYSIQVARVKNRVDKIKALMKDQISIVWDLSTIPNLGVIPLQYFDLILQEPEENISVCYTLFSRISTCENEFKPMLIKTVKKLMYAKELDKNPKLSYLLRTEFLQQLSIRFGNEVFLNEFLSTVIDRIIFVEKEPKIAELAKHACVWMAKRFGPIITAQHIITKLFILLECCCQNVTDTEIRISRYPDHPMDLHIKNITSVFVEIIVMFGPEFIFKQCLPYIKQKFEQASKNLTPNLESFVIGAMTLMPELCDLISARDFLAYLTNDENQGDYNVIIRFIMIPAIRILKANKATFLFSNVNARRLFASKLLSWIFQLIKRVSRDSTERFLRFGVLDELVSPFSQMYRKVSKVQYERIPEVHFNDQVLAIYDADFAKVCLQTCIEETSLEFFMQVVNYYDLIILISGGKPPILKAPNPKNETTEEKTERLSRAQALQENCEGNRKMKNAHQHISKTWVTAIFNTKESAESKAFNTIELANFEGHTNLIKRICVMDLENCFVTASVDTTVKLWTIKPYETLSHCQYSYTGHSKPLLDTRILAHGGLIASTDGILNIWDPFKSTTLHRLSWDESGKKDNINCLVPLSNYTLAASALTDSLIKIFDVRTGSFAYHMCPFNQNQFPTALVKCMSLSSCGTKMATGFTGSGLSLFDIRTGRILSTRTGIISGITSIEWVAQNHFAGLSNDHSTVICEANTLIKPIHKLPENSSALIPMKNQKEFITFYNNNRLKIYNDYNHRPTEIKTKDAIHGGITAGAYMNLNKTWIVGTSSGKIKLFF